jgi:hypothetical protein
MSVIQTPTHGSFISCCSSVDSLPGLPQVRPPFVYTRVSEHMPDIIDLVAKVCNPLTCTSLSSVQTLRVLLIVFGL